MTDFSTLFPKYLPETSNAISPESLEKILEESTFSSENTAVASQKLALTTPQPNQDQKTRGHSPLRSAGIWILSLPIHLYRYAISPMLPRSCRFEPSCSSYALEALKIHGPLWGGLYTLRRLARCHPWGGSGYDPVALPNEKNNTTATPNKDAPTNLADTNSKKKTPPPRQRIEKRFRSTTNQRFEREQSGVSVVAEPEFIFQASKPERNHFVWRCDVTLCNLSNSDLRLVSHMWLITCSDGAKIQVGDNQPADANPVLVSGAALFHSCTVPIGTPSALIKGSYKMIDDSGKTVTIDTPTFSLDCPWGNSYIH